MTTSFPEPYRSNFRLPPLEPDMAFVYSRFAHFLAFAAGAGLSKYAPGTVGTLVAFPIYWLLQLLFDPVALLLIIDIFYYWYLGMWNHWKSVERTRPFRHGLGRNCCVLACFIFFTEPLVVANQCVYLVSLF